MYHGGMRNGLSALCLAVLAAASSAAADRPALVARIRGRLAVIASRPAKDEAESRSILATLEKVDGELAAHATDADLAAPRPAAPPPAPDPAQLLRAAEDAASAALASLRAAAGVYFGDAEGSYPADLAALAPKHIDKIPAIEIGGHRKTNRVTVITKAAGESGEAYLKDTGGWLYFATPDNAQLNGTVLLDCKHKDLAGKAFSGR